MMLSLATEQRRPQRVAVNVEVQIDGEIYAGVGYGPYSKADAEQSIDRPAAEAVRLVVSSLAEEAVGIRRTKP